MGEDRITSKQVQGVAHEATSSTQLEEEEEEKEEEEEEVAS